MSRRRSTVVLAVLASGIAAGSLAAPPAAEALSPIDSGCPVGALVQPGCSLTGVGGLTSSVASSLTFVPLAMGVLEGASFALHATSQVLGETTSPQLSSTWFSSTYWRVAGIAAVLTLPFLFAAAIQALVRSDLDLLLRAALGYLPLAALAVAVATPMTMLLLAASDQLSATVSSAAGHQVAHFIARAISLLGAVGISLYSPFVLLMVGLLTVAGALTLWIELLVREAAVYVIVLLLPLAFAAFVWPARQVWAIRSVEVLVALILSKFAIVAVLSLGGAALDQSAGQSITGLLAGGVLMALAAFAPWAVLRLIPVAELASTAAASLKAGSQHGLLRLQQSDAWASEVNHWALKTAQMRGAGQQTGSGRERTGPEDAAGPDRMPMTVESSVPPRQPTTEPAVTTEAPAPEDPPRAESDLFDGPVRDIEADAQLHD